MNKAKVLQSSREQWRWQGWGNEAEEEDGGRWLTWRWP